MPSVYDDIFPAMPSQKGMPTGPSPYDDIQPQPFIGHQLPRWDARRTGGAPSLTNMFSVFGKEVPAAWNDVVRGTKELTNRLPFAPEEERAQFAEQLAAEQANQDAALAPGRAEYPMASGLGQGVPYMLAPHRTIPAMVAAALYEALKYAPTLAERGGGLLKGAVLGALSSLGGGVGRAAIQPTPGGPTATGLQGAAARIGAPLTAGQRSLDARTLQAEDYLRRTPFGSIPFERVNNEQRLAVNRATAGALGENVDSLTQDVLASAKDRITGVMDDLENRNALLPHSQLAQEIRNFRAALATDTTPDIQRVMAAQLARYEDRLLANEGRLPGHVYRELNTGLNRIVKRGGDLGYHARELLQIMRRGMARNISPDDRAAWEEANRQYRAYKLVTKRDFGVNEVTGDINAKALARALNAENDVQKRGLTNSPLGDVATFGRGLPPHSVGSQTAPRLFWAEARANPFQALTGLPGEYIPAWLMARGGLMTLHPAAQRIISPTLGYLGKAAVPGGLVGWLGQ